MAEVKTAEQVTIVQAEKAAKKVAAISAKRSLKASLQTKSEEKKSIAEGKLCQIYNGGGKTVLQFAASILFFKPAIATGIKALMAAIEAICEKEA